MRMRSIAVGAAALIAATAAAVVPAVTASASASGTTGKVIINTKSYGHMDTTSVSGSATFAEPNGNGPVWAIDSLNEQWTIVPETSPGNYSVTLKVIKGSKFSEFADPGAGNNETTDPCPGNNPGGPHTGSGNVTGTIQYDIQSSTAPDLSGVPAVQAPNTSLGTVLGQIFDNNQQIVGGGSYTFDYANVCGHPYEQTG